MAETTPETPVATQKRPLEDASPAAGSNDIPAKRQALDKVSKEDGTTAPAVVPDAVVAKDESERKSDNQAAVDDGNADDTTNDVTAVADASGPAMVTDNTEGTGATDHAAVADATLATNGANPAPGSPQARVQHHLDRLEVTVAEADRFEHDLAAAAPSIEFNQNDETTWFHLRALLGMTESGTVIGNKGENVAKIRQISGAKCTISDYVKGAVERIVTVSGSIDSVAKAYGLIVRAIKQEAWEGNSTAASQPHAVRLLVPHVLIGSIIGKSGARIRDIQDVSNARLTASESCLPMSSERVLIIHGVADAVHRAVFYVSITMADQLKQRWGSVAASNYAGRSGHAHGPVPGGMMVVPFVPLDIRGPDRAPRPSAYAPPPPQRAPAAPYNYPGYGGAPPTGHQMPDMGHYANAGPSRAHYPAAGPSPPPMYGPTPVHGGAPHMPMPGNVPTGQTTTQQIYIPNDMVGAVIGKGGAKINEIRNLSSCVIKINEPAGDSNERLVTVTGTPENNRMALFMLYSRLGESNKNSSPGMPR